eukprot:TRINITY_DN22757_c0_g1_i1.p1 TRINITY_DN22757_c0_g1~~TRINITY_DN22757_c0_g1_i1.p1  ORF type:complete len:163 (-),score=28.84 TRINITY_DN22757_c0_g1_i1:15-503(-)
MFCIWRLKDNEHLLAGGAPPYCLHQTVHHLCVPWPLHPSNMSGHSCSCPCCVLVQPEEQPGAAMIKSRGDLSISIKDYKDGRMTSSLILHNVTEDHYGGYSCNASNTEGEASAIIRLVQPGNTSGVEGLWRKHLLLVFTVFIGWSNLLNNYFLSYLRITINK